MTNLLFDTNYLFHKNVFFCHKNNALGQLWQALDNNINKYISMSQWDNIYLVSDSRKKSWRKQELETYKSQRKLSEEIDWKWAYETFEQWKKEKSEKYNIFISDHIEGDDWITSIILKSNKKGTSNCVISSDMDMTQLLNYSINKDKSFINIQINDTTGKEKVFVPEGYELWLKEFDENRNNDIFNLDNSHNWLEFVNKVIKNYTLEIINPKEILFIKLISGDSSDNIKSIYEKLTTTGKIRGIGEKGAEKIWNFYKDNYKPYFSTNEETFINDIINSLEQTNKIELIQETKNTVINNLKRNIKLIELNYKHFPEFVLEEIATQLENKI